MSSPSDAPYRPLHFLRIAASLVAHNSKRFTVVIVLALLSGTLLHAEDNPTTSAIADLHNQNAVKRMKAIIRIRASGEHDHDTVQALITVLETDRDAYVQWLAYEALNGMREAAQYAIPAALVQVKDSSSEAGHRRRAAMLLEAISYGVTQEAMDVYLPILRDRRENIQLRRQVAENLESADRQVINALPELVALLNEPGEDVWIRSSVANAIGKITADQKEPVAINALTAVVKNGSQPPQLRSSALQALGAMRQYARTAGPIAVEILKSKTSPLPVRLEGARFIRQLGEDASGATPALIEIASDTKETPELRVLAVDGLGTIRQAGPAVAAMIKLLSDGAEDPSLRLQIPWSLSSIGPGAPESLPIVSSIANDNSEVTELRRRCLQILPQIGADNPTVPPVIIAFIQNRTADLDLRLTAISASSGLHVSGRSISSALVKVIDDAQENKRLRLRSCDALMSIGVPESLTPLLALLLNRTQKVDLRLAAARAASAILARGGEVSPQNIEALLSLVRDDNENLQLRQAAITIFSAWQSNQGSVVPALMSILATSNDLDLRRQAAVSLSSLGQRFSLEKDADELLKIAADPSEDFQTRQSIIGALVRAGPAVAAPLVHIAEAKSQRRDIRLASLNTIGGLAPQDPSVAKALLALYADESESTDLRKIAAQTLGQLGPISCSYAGALVDGLRSSDDTLKYGALEGLSFLSERAVTVEALPCKAIFRTALSEIAQQPKLQQQQTGHGGITFSDQLSHSSEYLENLQPNFFTEASRRLVAGHPWILLLPILFCVYLLLLVAWLLLLYRRPLWLLQINESVPSSWKIETKHVKLSLPLTSVSISRFVPLSR